MDKIKAHYDKCLLIAAGILLVVVTLWLAMNASGLGESFVLPPPATKGEPFAPDGQTRQLAEDEASLKQVSLWTRQPGAPALFVSRIYLLREGRLVDILRGESELYPGIPNAWVLEHGLDYTDPLMPEHDADEDGFTNLEEFTAKTNPRDRDSRPPAYTKLRLVSSKLEKLRFTFNAVSQTEGDKIIEVQINTVKPDDVAAVSGRTKFYKLGDQVDIAERDAAGRRVDTRTPFKLLRAEMKGPNGDPVAVLLNTADGKEILLEQGKLKDSPYSLATLKNKLTGEQFQLRSGDEFELAGAGRYKLIDVTEKKAEIKALQSDEILPVPLEAASEGETPQAQ